MPTPDSGPYITRFAPSPTGYLHLGHAFAALFAYHAARRSGGHMLLRIEDIDPGRCKPEFEAAIYEDLKWLGVEWAQPVRRQLARLREHAAALQGLAQSGVVYPCFCTRKEIEAEIAKAAQAPHGAGATLYPGTCRELTAEERRQKFGDGIPYALRLDVYKAMVIGERNNKAPMFWTDFAAGEIECDPSPLGDVVLGRKDVPSSYHLSATLDDHLQGVTLVTRGKDLFHSTHIHRLLQALMGLNTPEYHHHKLLAGPDGKRFAKRDKSMTIRALREAGKTPEEVRIMAGFGPNADDAV